MMVDTTYSGAYNTNMHRPQIVLDTNVVVAALRSRRGASFRVLQQVGTGRFDLHVSVPLILEYEATLKGMVAELPLTEADIDAILDYLVAVARRHSIHFLWRPLLPDPKDDMLLEVAVAGQCPWIVTHNVRDFQGSEAFGIQAITPQQFLALLGEAP